MTAEAQTIPEDIFQTACGIVMNAKSLKSVLKHKDVADAIAAAIVAERERCAAVADRYGNVEIDTEHGEGYATAASNIAAAIRKGGA